MRTLAIIKDNATSAVSFGANALFRKPKSMMADATNIVIGLTNTSERQREAIRSLKRALAADDSALELARTKQADFEVQIANTVRLMTANHCFR